jgi:hypothetical protein
MYANAGTFSGTIRGSVFEGGSINIGNDGNGNYAFRVFENGDVQLCGNITWGTNNTPVQVQYSPDGKSNWGTKLNNTDYYARYSYDSGKTWTDAVLIRGKDGSSATVDHKSVFDALTKNGTLQGLYEENNNLYINASYIKGGTIEGVSFTSGGYSLRGTSSGFLIEGPTSTIMYVSADSSKGMFRAGNSSINHNYVGVSGSAAITENGIVFANDDTKIGNINNSYYSWRQIAAVMQWAIPQIGKKMLTFRVVNNDTNVTTNWAVEVSTLSALTI